MLEVLVALARQLESLRSPTSSTIGTSLPAVTISADAGEWLVRGSFGGGPHQFFFTRRGGGKKQLIIIPARKQCLIGPGLIAQRQPCRFRQRHLRVESISAPMPEAAADMALDPASARPEISMQDVASPLSCCPSGRGAGRRQPVQRPSKDSPASVSPHSWDATSFAPRATCNPSAASPIVPLT